LESISRSTEGRRAGRRDVVVKTRKENGGCAKVQAGTQGRCDGDRKRRRQQTVDEEKDIGLIGRSQKGSPLMVAKKGSSTIDHAAHQESLV